MDSADLRGAPNCKRSKTSKRKRKQQNIGQIQVNVTATSSDPVAVGAATKDATKQALDEAGRDLAVGE